jgi:SM-20-related protein
LRSRLSVSLEDLNDINSSLEKQSWYFKRNFISDEVCRDLYEKYSEVESTKKFSIASIGKNISQLEDLSIRKSSILWIEKTDYSKGLDELNIILEKIMISISRHFFLSLKHFESQIAFYNKGDYYKGHLDQFKTFNNRQVSCCLYLNDCPEGGELILYKKGSKDVIEKVIRPERGSLVVFFSGQIFHEVKIVEGPRFSLSTWFRDDELRLP